ncbi:MAG TPA: hypothetical protein VK190_02545 [Pseudoneobacillus sp.]|nr:hypothetical protein [Pseudoneobacillus sp.]
MTILDIFKIVIFCYFFLAALVCIWHVELLKEAADEICQEDKVKRFFSGFIILFIWPVMF